MGTPNLLAHRLDALAVAVITFVSVGTWTKWPATTDFYAQLAKAFDHGQVSSNQRFCYVLYWFSSRIAPGIRFCGRPRSLRCEMLAEKRLNVKQLRKSLSKNKRTSDRAGDTNA